MNAFTFFIVCSILSLSFQVVPMGLELDAMDIDGTFITVPNRNERGELEYKQVPLEGSFDELYPAFVKDHSTQSFGLYRCAVLACNNNDSYPKLRIIVEGFIKLFKEKLELKGKEILETFKDVPLSINSQKAIELIIKSIQLDKITGEVFKFIAKYGSHPHKVI